MGNKVWKVKGRTAENKGGVAGHGDEETLQKNIRCEEMVNSN